MADKHKFQCQYFLFLYNIRRPFSLLLVLLYLMCSMTTVLSDKVKECNGKPCYNGNCTENNTICHCFDGWAGDTCSYCFGRVRITADSGVITEGIGNYSTDNKCMWLVEPESKGAPLRLTPVQFATECGWDHLYIFDGDSIYSPLIAAYSGLVLPHVDGNKSLEEAVATSGKAYIYFYSDAAYNMSGFLLNYTVGLCSKNCSGHGSCVNSTCVCDNGYTGTSCDVDMCPNACSNNGACDSATGCVCDSQYKGLDCSTEVTEESWVRYQGINPPVGRASAASLFIGEELAISGGYAFGHSIDFLITYNVTSHEWDKVKPSSTNNPELLYGHSMVLYKDCLYLYGGVSGQHIESKLWIYNITNSKWSYKDYNETNVVAGHTAVVINSTMYIIFGHSPIYGYMNTVRELLLDTKDLELRTLKTTGALVKGGYGASSVYNEDSGEIYVYGGYVSGIKGYSLTDKLYSFNPVKKQWRILASSGSVRYLHTAVWLGDLMLVFGGNTHNDTNSSLGAKCYSADFIAYDPVCNSWKNIDSKNLLPNAARYGHTAQPYFKDNRMYMYVFGGFTGLMQNDVMVYEPGSCSVYTDNDQCVKSYPGRVCVWTENGCMDRYTAQKEKEAGTITDITSDASCLPLEGAAQFCSKQKSCGSCLSTVYDCKWCSNNCSVSCSETEKYVVSEVKDCPRKYNTICSKLNNCHACVEHDECKWNDDNDKRCSYQPQDSIFESDVRKESKKEACDTPCYLHTSCEECTPSCMWCGSQQRCVETNSYVASFLYGQCQEWVTDSNKCHVTRCSEIHTCEECKSNPACGWCNDESNTGLGKCVRGSATGPVSWNNVTDKYQVDNNVCPNEQWHFIECPLCQCNGHSTCKNVSDECDACHNLTEGSHCDKCIEGFYGNPKNGGNCTACSCNGQAEKCNSQSGLCYCRTRGVKGDKCQICDTQNNYFGNPNDGGTCYYDLRTDYQFTFNLSKPEDAHYTGINFMNIPVANDRDVDFTLNCSGHAYINITWKSKSHSQEQYLTREYLCTYFRSKFEHKDYNFGPDDNVTFYVYVYNFNTTPNGFWLQISFSQFPKIDLVHFFVTFFSCFLTLLIIAAVLYKVKHKYDSYRRRQRMIVEMEEMASRPFASAIIEVDRKVENTCAQADKKDTNPDLRKRKRPSNKPGQVALEPLHNQKAAVLSLFVQLPCGDEDWCPAGSSGLAIGSALVSFGHQRKQSTEFVKNEKTKHKKHAFSVHDTHV